MIYCLCIINFDQILITQNWVCINPIGKQTNNTSPTYFNEAWVALSFLDRIDSCEMLSDGVAILSGST